MNLRYIFLLQISLYCSLKTNCGYCLYLFIYLLTRKFDLYHEQFRGRWDGVSLSIERPGPVDPVGPCSNTRAIDDQMTVQLEDSKSICIHNL